MSDNEEPLRRRFLGWVFVLVLGLSGCAPHTNPEPIWVGHLAPLSGMDRALGEQARHAIELSAAEAGGETKVAGRPVYFLHVDSRNDEETVRAEAVRLVTVNKVLVLIGSLDARLAERLVAEGHSLGVPVVVTGEVTSAMRGEGALRLGISAAKRGHALAQFLMEQKRTPLACVSDDRSPLAAELAESFVHQVSKEKGHVRKWTFDGGAEPTDWLEDVLRDQPSAVLLACSPTVFARLHGVLRQKGFKGTLIYGGEDRGVLALPPESEIEILLATVCCKEGLTARGKEIAAKFEETYQEPASYAAYQTYDAARLVVDAMQPGGQGGQGQKYRDRLLRMGSFECLTGTITFQGKRTLRPLFLLQKKGRDSKLLKTIAPETE